MKLALLVALPLLMAACGPGLHEIDREPQDATKDAAAAFTKASQTGDVATIRKMLGPSVVNGGLWFPDPTCEAEFAVPGEVGGGRLDELARCLTTVKLSTSQRKDALLDVAVLSYEPGIEIEARFIDRSTGTWLSWIGYAARHDVADALPTITPDALESLRVAGQREPAVPELDAELAASPRKYTHTWVKLCIDATGAVTGVHVREASSHRAAAAYTRAVADWKFKPFAPAGQPIPVCSMLVLAHPLAEALDHEGLPYPLSTDAFVVPAIALKDLRISGNKMIVPDDATKMAIQRAGIRRLIGMYQLCLDVNGVVHDLRMLRSTGVPPYDARILTAMAQWRYKPFLDEGQPSPVCTEVTFVYSQR